MSRPGSIVVLLLLLMACCVKVKAAEGAQDPRSASPFDTTVPGGGTFGDKIVLPLTGWTPRSPKRAVVSLATRPDQLPAFRVTQGGRTVLAGITTYGGRSFNIEGYVADLSAIKTPGVYQIVSGNLAPRQFEVYEDVYSRIRSTSTTMVGIADTIDSFWVHFQRDTTDTYRSVPTRILTGSPKPFAFPDEPTTPPATSGDLRGGWFDATSHDKETSSEAVALANLVYALETTTSKADKAALLAEVRWGVRYLLQIQNADGSFPIACKPHAAPYDPDPRKPDYVLVNVDKGVVAKCVAALAAASTVIDDRAMADRCLQAATRAYGYMTTNPTAKFLWDGNVYPSYWRGHIGSVLGANVEMARATHEQQYMDQAIAFIRDGQFRGGCWCKTSGNWPAQNTWDQDELDTTLTSLLRLHALARPDVQSLIRQHAKDWASHWQATTRDNAYRVTATMFVPWFGGQGRMTHLARGFLLMGSVLNDPAAAESGRRIFEWNVGANPFGTSWVYGFGGAYAVHPFGRTADQSLGAVFPGFVTDSSGGLTVAPYHNGATEWQINEATIDSTSVMNHVLLLLDQSYGH